MWFWRLGLSLVLIPTVHKKTTIYFYYVCSYLMRFRERTLTTEKSTLFKCLVLLLQFCWSQKAGREFNKIQLVALPIEN